MKKTVEVELQSQAKSVTAKASVIVEGDENTNPDTVLEEAQRLFSKAEKFALDRAMERNR